MSLIKKLSPKLLLFSLLLYIFLLIYKHPLPNNSDIVKPVINIAPMQNKIKLPPIHLDFKDFNYEIIPDYSYEIYGLIVEQYKSTNILDVHHKKDPVNTRDLCLVWGENITNGSYKKVKYSHGEFTCFYRWNKPLNPPFNSTSFSNNHLIPANIEVAKKINKPNIGDQVRVKGYLASYKVYSKAGKEITGRGTSITREDSGNGACEVIYVTEIEVLKSSNRIYYFLKRILPYFITIIIVATLVIFFLF